MNKSIIAGASILLIAGGSFASMTVADSKIKELYTNTEIGILKNFQAENTDFGFTGGTVDWHADIILDPCQPNLKLTLSGSDTIKKGLTGYTITSKIKPDFDDPQIMQLIDKLPEFQLTSKINWLGNANSSFIFPAYQFADADTDISISWSDITGDFNFHKKDKKIIARDLNFQWDNASLNIDSLSANIQNINYTSDLPMGYILDSGKSDFSIESLQVKDNSNTANQVIIKDISTEMQQMIDSDKVGIDILYAIGLIDINMNNQNLSIKDTKSNLNIAELDRPTVDSIVTLLEKSTKECVPQTQLLETLTTLSLDLMKAGFSINSTDNQINVGDSIATASANITLPEYNYTSIEEVAELLPSQAKYTVNVEFDKSFIQNMLQLASKNEPVNEEILEESWQQIITLTDAKTQGDHLIINKSN